MYEEAYILDNHLGKMNVSPDVLPKSQFQLTCWWRKGGERLETEKESWEQKRKVGT